MDRAVLNLGSLSNTDPASGGTAGDSEIKVSFSAIVIRNPDVTASTQQYVSIGAEYSGSNYVQISQEAFTPDSTATDIVGGAAATLHIHTIDDTGWSLVVDSGTA